MRFLQFILSHSIFIAFCAAGLCFQTHILLHRPADLNIYGFIFFSTLCGYNLYWLQSKFYFSDRKLNRAFFKRHYSFFLLFGLAAIGTFYFLLKIGWLLPYIAVGGVLTLLYALPLWPFAFAKHLQKAGFFKTTLLSLTWAYVTVVIPAAGSGDMVLMPITVLFCARFSFMLLLCIIFDMRDISVDKVHGLHSLATDLSKKTLDIIIYLVFGLYILAGLLVRAYFNDDRQMLAFIVTGMIVWLVYRMSLRRKEYIFYYFLVDGLMLISSLLSFLATVF